MMTQPSHDTGTRLLVAAQEGDRLAINELFPLIDYARKRKTQKRGGDVLSFDEMKLIEGKIRLSDERADALVAFDEG